ncbi:acyltransferase family protein [Micromonospora sp. CPCC 206061]|uniref:acyltransferase family protein n=1 Tax=Micromonospora sp. CPCC 206061 TaxID=3122410 RepID=UPI002FEFBD6C
MASEVTQARPVAAERRPELDAIRAFVVVGLVFFHSALIFDAEDDYYVKNPETTSAIMIAAGFAVVWAMPILFLIAGLGSWHSMRKRGPRGFAVERLLRLGVPLVFATLTIIPIPQWLRLRAADPGYDESYPRFLLRFFDVHLDLGDFPFILDGEHFETGHLWFIVLLLAFSLMLAAVARLLAGRAAQAGDRGAAAVTRHRGLVLLPAVPIAVICALLGLEEAFAGWSRWAYLLFFLFGFVLAADGRFRDAMRRDAVIAAVVGVAVFAAGMPLFLAVDEPFTEVTPLAMAARALFGVAGWCWVTGILGLLDRRRRRPAPACTGPARPPSRKARAYAYLGTAVLPLYILHQPIVVAVAYHVVRWDASIPVKYLAIVAASLALTVAAYDLLVRRTPVTRFLFGMRP